MAHEITDWFQQIKAVEREHSVVAVAVNRMLAVALRDPTHVAAGIKVGDIRRASERLSGTYVIRLFAEFETGIRLYWSSIRRAVSPRRTRDLLDSVAAMRQTPHLDLANAHQVREYRNLLVHDREGSFASIEFAVARGYLSKFLSFLPRSW
jgi:hypothetical protein